MTKPRSAPVAPAAWVDDTDSVATVVSAIYTSTDISAPIISVDIDTIASALHDAQVSDLRKQAEDSGNLNSFSFSTWNDLTEASRDSRRSAARYLLTKFDIFLK